MRTYFWKKLSATEQIAALARPVVLQQIHLQAEVKKIVHAVKMQGDKALLALTAQYDCVQLQSLQVTAKEFAQANAIATRC